MLLKIMLRRPLHLGTDILEVIFKKKKTEKNSKNFNMTHKYLMLNFINVLLLPNKMYIKIYYIGVYTGTLLFILCINLCKYFITGL